MTNRHRDEEPLPVTGPIDFDPTGATEPSTGPISQVPEDQSTSSQGVAKASAVMAAGTLISRVLGFVRTSLLALAIGSTVLVADVFETANTIPNVIYMLLAGGVFNVVLVPQLIKAAKNPDRGSDYTSRLLSLSILIIGGFTIALTALAYPVMKTLTLGWSEPKLALGTAFALWTLPQVFFYGMYAIVGQILNAHGRFGAYMWAPVVNNVIAITVIVVYLFSFGKYSGADDATQLAEWTNTQTVLLAGGHTLGIVAQAVVLWWPLKRLGLGLRLKFGWKGMGLRTTGRLAGFTMITMFVGNISNLFINRLVTGATEARSSLGDTAAEAAAIPGLYALNISQLITVLPHSVFVLSIATVLFNQLTRYLLDDDIDAARGTISEGLKSFAVPMMFSMIVVIVLAVPMGRLFSGSSETATYSAAAIGQILLLLALGMPVRSAHFYLLRVFYASENALIPMVVQVTASVLSLGLAYGIGTLVPANHIAFFVALVFTGVHFVQFTITHLLTRKHLGDYGLTAVVGTYLRVGVVSIVSGIAGAAVLWLMGGFDLHTGGFAYASIFTALLTCAVVGVVMIIVFLVVAKIFRVEDVARFINPLLSRLKRG